MPDNPQQQPQQPAPEDTSKSAMKLPKLVKDETGRKHSRLKVIDFNGLCDGVAYWNCICDCGKAVIVAGTQLRKNHTRSCGCLHAEAARRNGLKQTGEKHKLSNEEVIRRSTQPRECNECNQLREPHEFGRLTRCQCIYCHYAQRRNKQLANWEEHVLSVRSRNLKKKYSLTLEEFNVLSDSQNGLCAICGKDNDHASYKTLCVDHNHSTNALRGLLCHRCNAGLGHFRESRDILSRAIIYLDKYEPNRFSVVI